MSARTSSTMPPTPTRPSRAPARAAVGVDVTLEPWQDMIHVFQAFAPILPEGQQAIEKIGEFLRARWA